MATGTMIGFRDPVIEQQLGRRISSEASAGQIAKRDLGRFYAILAETQRQLAFTPQEIHYLSQNIDTGFYQEPGSLHALPQDFSRHYPQVKPKDAEMFQKLSDKLISMSSIELLALIDLLEQYDN